MSCHGRLRVRRGDEQNDLGRRYPIFVNDEQVAELKRGAFWERSVEPGRYTVQARLDWCSSPAVTVDVMPGETVTLHVENSLHGWRAWLFPFVITNSRDHYLKMRVLGAVELPPQRARHG